MRKGFTLIELLVVIAIIAILAAILFPVFARAKAKAQQAACLSNSKQLILAFLQYAHDYDYTLPLDCEGNLLTVYPIPPPYKPWSGKAGYLYPYLQSIEVQYCPAMMNQWYGSRSVMGYLTNDYFWNDAYGLNTRRWAGIPSHPGGAGILPGTVYPAKTLEFFNYPTHFIIMGEGYDNTRFHTEVWPDGTTHQIAGGALAGSVTLQATDPPRLGSVNGGLTGRHNGMINCQFLDGHVKALSPAQLANNATYYFSASKSTAGAGQAAP